MVTPCGGTGLQEDSEDLVSIYPNPTNGPLLLSPSKTKISLAEIYSKEGRKLNDYRYMENLDISNFPDGIYIVVLHLDNGTTTTLRVVKN